MQHWGLTAVSPILQVLRTFLGVTPTAWKWGSNTAFETSSSPLSFALPIRVIGVSLLMHLDFCLLSALIASEQSLCTKVTGSTGARVLKNRTARII